MSFRSTVGFAFGHRSKSKMVFGKKVFADSDPNEEDDFRPINRTEGDVEENQEMGKEDGYEDEDDKFPFVEGPQPDDENCFCFCFCEKDEDGSDPEEEEEVDLVDPQDELKESCSDKKECQSLKERLDECNSRVESRSKTSENCVEEIIDFMHCVDHCVAKTLFAKLK